MTRKKASDFDPRLLELYDGYVHGKMTKRAFLSSATKYAAAGVTAAALLEACNPIMRWRSRWPPTTPTSKPRSSNTNPPRVTARSGG